MSHQATTWVMEFSKSKLASRLVLLAIAHRISNDSGEAFPSVRTIEREANLSESAVHGALRNLVELGELEIDRGTSRLGTNIYRMPRFKLWIETIHQRTGAEFAPPTRRRQVQRRGAGSGPEPSLGTIKEPSENLAAASRPDPPLRILTESQKRYGETARLICEVETLLVQDATEGRPRSFADLKEDVKRLAATKGFRYDGDMVTNAIDIAERRLRAGESGPPKTHLISPSQVVHSASVPTAASDPPALVSGGQR